MNTIVLIGNSCIGLSFGLCILGLSLFAIGRKINDAAFDALGRAAVYGTFILMTIANLAMVRALLTNDFAVSYVAHVGSRATPRWVSAVSLWSSLEGSILFWGWVLTAYAAVCIYLHRKREERLVSWGGMILLGVQLFFFILLALPANPFLPMTPPPADGPGPNPLLQNHWLMTAHPPFLYIGYIGFVVPFAMTLAALIAREYPDSWIRSIRRLTLFPWSFLSLAIVLGGWWSYAVLGWGGYWAWDPVENASFMPWLSATALIHSIMVQERRRLFTHWTVLLTIVTFLLTLLGTFLTRSGILESVHAFTESTIGPYFLVFIGLVMIGSLGLLLSRWEYLRTMGSQSKIESLMSLEVLLLFNNLLFVSFCFIVFLGTFYPLIREAVTGERVSVGGPYFNQLSAPIALMILILMGIGIIVPWRRGAPDLLWRKSLLPAIGAIFITIGAIMIGERSLWVLIVILFASFAFFIMVTECWNTFRKGTFSRHVRRFAAFIAHIGALMIILAIALSSHHEKKKEMTLATGESMQIDDYTLTLTKVDAHEATHRFEVRAILSVTHKGKPWGDLVPQMNYYPTSQQPVGSPAVRSTLREDLYLTLLSVDREGGKAAIRAIVTPAVAWIWIGGVTVFFGGLLTIGAGRKQSPKGGL